VTRDDIRKLMGSYATGSLSDAERKALYEAALDDQDLFEELAREQAMREVIAEPGVRDRLIARLAADGTKPQGAAGGWRKGLAWALATTFVVSMSVAAVMIVRSGTSRNVSQPVAQQNAKLETPARPVAVAPAGAASRSTAGPKSAPVANVLEADRKVAREKKAEAGGSAAPEQHPAPASAPVPAIADVPLAGRRADTARAKDASEVAQNNEAAKSPQDKSQQEKSKQSSDQVQVTGSAGGIEQLAQAQLSRGQSAAAPAPPPAPQSRSVAQLQPGRGGATTGGFRAAAGSAGTISRAIGGGGGGAGLGGAARVPAHFAFDYTVNDAVKDGVDGEELTLKFAADGYISIHFVPGGVTVVEARVTAGSTRRERIPANATEIVILFTAAPQAGSPGVSFTREGKDGRSGTAEDPGRARIDLLLRLY
jgi:hypothetical protein